MAENGLEEDTVHIQKLVLQIKFLLFLCDLNYTVPGESQQKVRSCL